MDNANLLGDTDEIIRLELELTALLVNLCECCK